MNDNILPKVVIWGDGQGSTFRATVDAINADIVRFDVAGVITTSKEAGILEHVKYANKNYKMNIKTLIVPGKPGRRQDVITQQKVLNFLKECNAQSLVLMGALVIMGDIIVKSLNGDLKVKELPRNLEDAQKLMVKKGKYYTLPSYFPEIDKNPGKYGLTNSHPAPTLVTANTHGVGAQNRVLQLGSLDSAVTYHAVASSIDTGPILAAHIFPTCILLSKNASQAEIAQHAYRLNKKAQRIEKAYLPLDVEKQLYSRQKYLLNK